MTFGAGGQRSNPLSYGRAATLLLLRLQSRMRVLLACVAAELVLLSCGTPLFSGCGTPAGRPTPFSLAERAGFEPAEER